MARNAAGHHDDFLVGQLRVLPQPAVQPLRAEVTLPEGLDIDATLYHRQFALGHCVVFKNIVPDALGDGNQVVGPGHDRAVRVDGIHAMEG